MIFGAESATEEQTKLAFERLRAKEIAMEDQFQLDYDFLKKLYDWPNGYTGAIENEKSDKPVTNYEYPIVDKLKSPIPHSQN